MIFCVFELICSLSDSSTHTAEQSRRRPYVLISFFLRSFSCLFLSSWLVARRLSVNHWTTTYPAGDVFQRSVRRWDQSTEKTRGVETTFSWGLRRVGVSLNVTFRSLFVDAKKGQPTYSSPIIPWC